MKVIRTSAFEESLWNVDASARAATHRILERIEERRRYLDVVQNRARTYLIEDSPVWRWKVNRKDRLLYQFVRSEEGHVAVVPIGVYGHAEYDQLRKAANRAELKRLAELVAGDPTVANNLLELDNGDVPVRREVPHNAIGLRLGLVDLYRKPGNDQVEETRSAAKLIRFMQTRDPESFIALASSIASMPTGSDFRDVIGGVSIESLSDEKTQLTIVRAESEVSGPTIRTYDRPTSIESWKEIVAVSESAIDPFLALDDSQIWLLESFASPFHALPAFIDGPGGSGKTTLLMAILRGVLQNREFYGEDLNARLVTVNRSHVNTLRHGIRNYLKLRSGISDADADEFAKASCLSLDDFLVSLLPADRRAEFSANRKVRWADFSKWHREAFPSKRSLTTAAWAAIRILIGGDRLCRDEEDPIRTEGESLQLWFEDLNERRRQGLSDESFAHGVRVLDPYRSWKKDSDRWDDTDLLQTVLEVTEDGLRPDQMIDLFLIDEAQDLTPDQIRVVLRAGACLAYDIDRENEGERDESVNLPLPFLFAADDLQTINPSGFSWSSFAAIFYEETRALLNRKHGLQRDRVRLTTNYRMRGRPHAVSTGVRRWLDPGQEPVQNELFDGTAGPWTGSEESLVKVLQLADVILIPENLTREQMVEKIAKDPLLSRSLLDEFQRRKVLSTQDAKGQEWSTIVNYGFARYVRSTVDTEEFRYAKQVTYVAASRAQDNCVWFDTEDDREWFWKRSTDDASPARYLTAYSEVSTVGQLEDSLDGVDHFADALLRLRRALTDDLDQDERMARVRLATAQFMRSGATQHAETSARLEALLEGTISKVSLRDVPEELYWPTAAVAIRTRSWDSFESPPAMLGEERLVTIYGRLKLAESRGQSTEAVDVLAGLLTEDLLLMNDRVRAFDEEPSSFVSWLSHELLREVEAKPMLHLADDRVSDCLWRLAKVARDDVAGEVIVIASVLRHDWIQSLVETSKLGRLHQFRRRLPRIVLAQIVGFVPTEDVKLGIFDLSGARYEECRKWMKDSVEVFARLPAVRREFETMDGRSLGRLTEDQFLKMLEVTLEDFELSMKEISDVGT